jgi:hypothetical protein
MGKRIGHKRKSPYESRRKRDDYDRVWAYDRETEQARWDEAQDEALQASADRFERSEEKT